MASFRRAFVAAGTAPSVRGSSLGPDEEEEADAVGSPIVLLVHGLGDDVHHPYMRRAARAFHRVGWRVCAYSYWRADWYDTRDLQEVVAHLARRFPSSPLVCVGCAEKRSGLTSSCITRR